MPKILIIEPYRDAIALLKTALCERIPEIQIRYIISGSEARSAMYTISEEDLPNAVIIDYVMMSLYGIGLVGETAVPDHWKEIPFIVWSDSMDSCVEETSAQAGATKIQKKPNSYQGYVEFADEIAAMCRKAITERMSKGV